MWNRRFAIAGLALVAAIGLSGCRPEGDRAAGPAGAGQAVAEQSSKPADPAAELAAAATKLSQDSVKVKMTSAAGLNAAGAVDKSGEKADMTMKLGTGDDAITFAVRKIGKDLYLKFDGAVAALLGDSAGKWMHADATKVPEDSPFNMQSSDPRSAAKLIASAAQVQKTGERSFRGVLDLTKSSTMNEEQLKALGAKANAVPFTAEADDQGRLTELVIDLEAVGPGAGKMTTTYYDFGVPVSVQAPPASQVIEMPDRMLGVVGA